MTLIGHGIPHIDPHRHIGNIEQSAPQYDASYYRQAHNLKVAGSNPAPATKPIGTPVWTPAGVPFLFSTVKLPYRCSPPPQHHLQPSAAETPPNLRRLPQPPPKTAHHHEVEQSGDGISAAALLHRAQEFALLRVVHQQDGARLAFSAPGRGVGVGLPAVMQPDQPNAGRGQCAVSRPGR